MQQAYRNTAIFIFLVLIGVQWGFYQSYTSHFPVFKNATTLDTYTRCLTYDVDAIADRTTSTHSLWQGPPAQDHWKSFVGVGSAYYCLAVPHRQGRLLERCR